MERAFSWGVRLPKRRTAKSGFFGTFFAKHKESTYKLNKGDKQMFKSMVDSAAKKLGGVAEKLDNAVDDAKERVSAATNDLKDAKKTVKSLASDVKGTVSAKVDNAVEKAKDAKFEAEMAVKGKIRNGLKETTEQIQKAEGKLNND